MQLQLKITWYRFACCFLHLLQEDGIVLSSTTDGVTMTCTSNRYCTPRKSDLLVDSDRHGASEVACTRVNGKVTR